MRRKIRVSTGRLRHEYLFSVKWPCRKALLTSIDEESSHDIEQYSNTNSDRLNRRAESIKIINPRPLMNWQRGEPCTAQHCRFRLTRKTHLDPTIFWWGDDGTSSQVPLRINASNSADMAALGSLRAWLTHVGSIYSVGQWVFRS